MIGRTGRSIKSEEARSSVAGYTIVNDVTARSFIPPRRLDFKQDWLMGKSCDTFCPMGPYLVPDAFVENPERLHLRTTVNGQVMQDARTDDLTHGIGDMLAFLSQNITLLPGDVLSTGTPSGVGFECLPEVVDAVQGKIPVLVDGGFRRGTDIFKALALGAKAICIGRPYLWGLAAFGQPGVEKVLDLLTRELELMMRHAGATSLARLNRNFITAKP